MLESCRLTVTIVCELENIIDPRNCNGAAYNVLYLITSAGASPGLVLGDGVCGQWRNANVVTTT